jgi:hypothetical protein
MICHYIHCDTAPIAPTHAAYSPRRMPIRGLLSSDRRVARFTPTSYGKLREFFS